MKNINRRDSPRMEIKLRCHVTSPQLGIESAMNTENISRNGVLIAWRGKEDALPAPVPGQILTIDIELPVQHRFGRKCIHCQGTIVRVAGADPAVPLVALRVNYMDFRALADGIHAVDSGVPAAASWMT